MSSPAIAQVVFGLPVEGPFDYLIPESLMGKVAAGQRVLVRFAGTQRVGIVVGLLHASTHAGKFSVIISVLDETPVFAFEFLQFADVLGSRVACTPGEALELFLPSYLRKRRLFKTDITAGSLAVAPRKVLPLLVFDRGLTRRWEVLLPQIAAVLAAGRGVLVLVPEASRCPDVLPKLGALVGAQQRVFMMRGTEKEEYARWCRIRSGEARLVAGFISAVFAPVRDLGMIVIIDEESAFYQHDQSPFYHARAAAFERARIEGARVVCVSSAPSVEMWQMVVEGRAEKVMLDAVLAPVRFLDLTNFKMKRGRFLSPGARQQIEAVLQAKGQVLVYVPAARGVENVVKEMQAWWPGARVAGYDKASGDIPEADVLVATQAVFRHRGHWSAALTVLLDIDWELHKQDHQAAHGAFALVQYLRQMTQSQLLVQTRHAADPLLQTLACADAGVFYDHELSLRRQMQLPPFTVIASLIVRSADPLLACAEAKRLYDMLHVQAGAGVSVLEPQQDRTPVVRGKFRYCISVQGDQHHLLVSGVRAAMKLFRPKKDTVVTVRVNG